MPRALALCIVARVALGQVTVSAPQPVSAPGAPVMALSDHSDQPVSIAFDGSVYWVVWVEDTTGVFQVRAARVLTGGSVVDTTPIVVLASPGDQRGTGLGCAMGTCVVAVESYRYGQAGLEAARLLSSGQVLGVGSLAAVTLNLEPLDPVIASDGTGFFVAWWTTKFYVPQATRLDAAGNVLDPGGLLPNMGVNRALSATFDGVNYVLIESDRPFSNPSIEYWRVSPSDGGVLGTAPVLVAGAGNGPAVTADGQKAWVGWLDNGNTGAFVSRVAQSGGLLDDAGIRVLTGNAFQSVATASSGLGVVWLFGQSTVVSGARIGADGGVLDSVPVTFSAGGQVTPGVSAACSTTNCLVGWSERPPTTAYASEILVRRVDATGTVLDAAPLHVTPPRSGTAAQSHTQLACNATECLVVWLEQGDYTGYASMLAERLALDAGLLDPTPFVLASGSPLLSYQVVASPSQFLVVFDPYLTNLVGFRVALDGGTLDPSGFTVSSSSGQKDEISASFNGSEYRVAWQNGGLYGTSVSLSGAVRPTRQLSNLADFEEWPTVASNGSSTSVAWIDGRSGTSIYSTVWLGDGGVASSAGVPLATGVADTLGYDVHNNLPMTSAMGRSSVLAVWPQRQSLSAGPTGSFGLWGARLDLNGVPQGGPFQLVGVMGNAFQPTLSFDGQAYLLVWTDQRSGQSELRGLRLDEDGGVVTPDFPVSALPGSLHPASVPMGPGQVLVAYQRFDGTAGVQSSRVEVRVISTSVLTDGGSPGDGGTGGGGAGGGSGGGGTGGGGGAGAGGGTGGGAGAGGGGGTGGGAGAAGGGGSTSGTGGGSLQPLTLGVGCGCRSAPEAALVWLTALAMMRRVRAVRRLSEHNPRP
jgi:hypothetical protein